MVKRGWSTCWSTSSQRSLTCDYLIETPPLAAKLGGRFAISHVHELSLKSFLLAISADVVGLGHTETTGQHLRGEVLGAGPRDDGVADRNAELGRFRSHQVIKPFGDPHSALSTCAASFGDRTKS